MVIETDLDAVAGGDEQRDQPAGEDQGPRGRERFGKNLNDF